jgi:CheY-like chemotaxis protein
MNREGPIIFIEDDLDDQEIFRDVFNALAYENEIVFFPDGESALDYLNNNDVEPFIIFSDINMPKLSGMELRSQIHENENLRIKTIPYLFFSTSNEQQHVVDAYSKSIQGSFTKPSTYGEIKALLKSIVEYWQHCVSPNYTK